MEYSQAKKKLFTYFGYEELIDRLAAPTLYRMCAELAFVSAMRGSAVDALRKGLKALMYRMTPEWDQLIAFEDKSC